MEILKFITAGSVDDGKSTLIGRLLLDSKSILEDSLEEAEKSSLKRGDTQINLALLTDGLKAERDQGITIDVAYRFFSTDKRRFVMIDAPGHVQYTRNMVTGASNADLVVIIVDASKGILEQTRRHAFIASLLKINHFVVCINKMDLVDYSEEVYRKIVQDFEEFSPKLNIKDLTFIPISALAGDNVVERSEKMPWYYGAPLLRHLEEVYIASEYNQIDLRFLIQGVIRPPQGQASQGRWYSGQMASGLLRKGEAVMVVPGQHRATIKDMRTFDGELSEAFAPQSLSILLDCELDVGRGDSIVRENNLPEARTEIDAYICWLDSQSLNPNKTYYFRHNVAEYKVRVSEIKYKIDISTFSRLQVSEFHSNDIGRVLLKANRPVFADSYEKNKHYGCGILIDEDSHQTVAAIMIR
jgi:sulfate adenylyltransferase subunit 1